MDQKISRRITFIGFFMTCAVVLFHCYDGQLTAVSAADEEIYNGINSLFSTLLRLAMCWFFSVSGFLHFRDYEQNKYFGKIKRRAFSLLVPYLLWETAGGILNQTLLREPGRVLRNIFLLQKWPPVGPLWYMYAIFLLALISPILYALLKGKRAWSGCVLFLLLIGVAYLNNIAKSPIAVSFRSYGFMDSILNYLPAYLTGCYFGIHEHDREKNVFTDGVLILLAALIAEPVLAGFFLQTVYCVLPVFMFHAFPVFSAGGRKKYLFNLSFLMYAIHSYPTVHITPWIRDILRKITPEAWFANLEGRFAVLLLVILLAAGVWLLLSAVCPAALRIITGGRVKPLEELK